MLAVGLARPDQASASTHHAARQRAQDEVPERILLRIHIGARGRGNALLGRHALGCFLGAFLDGAGEPLLRGPRRPTAGIQHAFGPAQYLARSRAAHRAGDGLPRRGLGFCQTRQLCRRLVWRQSLIQQRAERRHRLDGGRAGLALAAPSGLHEIPTGLRALARRPKPAHDGGAIRACHGRCGRDRDRGTQALGRMAEDATDRGVIPRAPRRGREQLTLELRPFHGLLHAIRDAARHGIARAAHSIGGGPRPAAHDGFALNLRGVTTRGFKLGPRPGAYGVIGDGAQGLQRTAGHVDGSCHAQLAQVFQIGPDPWRGLGRGLFGIKRVGDVIAAAHQRGAALRIARHLGHHVIELRAAGQPLAEKIRVAACPVEIRAAALGLIQSHQDVGGNIGLTCQTLERRFRVHLRGGRWALDAERLQGLGKRRDAGSGSGHENPEKRMGWSAQFLCAVPRLSHGARLFLKCPVRSRLLARRWPRWRRGSP